MSVLRRIMLSGIDINNIPESNKLYYTATAKVEPKIGSLGSRILINKYDPSTNEGIIVTANSIVTIGSAAFKDNLYLTNIILPENTINIEEDAFYHCSNLLYFPDLSNIALIGNRAFSSCNNLITPIIIQGKDKILDASIFYGCSADMIIDCNVLSVTGVTDGYEGENITITKNAKNVSITFPSNKFIKNVIVEDGGITSISRMMFNNCTSLVTVSLPPSIIEIGDYAFSGCTSLIECNVSENLQTLGDYAFSGCTSLPNTNGIRSAGVVAVSFADFKELYDFSEYCFLTEGLRENSTITSVFIPDTIMDIKENCFTRCSNLVLFEGKYTNEGGKIIHKGDILIAFASPEISSFTIPTYITTLGKYSLYGKKFDELTIPSTVSFNERACAYISCNTLKLYSNEVSFNKNNIWSSNGSFAYNKIKKVILKDSTIGSWWFSGCEFLEYVEMHYSNPNKYTTINEHAFYNCSKLNTIQFLNDTEGAIPIPKLVDDYTFYGLPENFQIVVSDSLYDPWIVTTNWRKYADHIIKKSDWDASQTTTE